MKDFMNAKALKNTIHVLLIEDDPDDVLLLKEAFSRCSLAPHLHVVGSGEEALAFLQRKPPYEQMPRPRFILLDLFLPGISGLDVLHRLKQDASLRSIPVVVLTVSQTASDLLASYDALASAFVPKPGDRHQFDNLAERLSSFWFSVAQLPS